MNRIEEKMAQLKEAGKKAFITYTTAGLPDLDTTKRIIRTQEAAGIDVIELGIPFSDPVADGPVIQDASYKAILNGTTLKKVFEKYGFKPLQTPLLCYYDLLALKYDEDENAPILIQLVAPVSKQRIPMLLENARGFVYCVSQMGVTGKGANFHKDIRKYLEEVKSVSKVPVMMGFGIRTAQDVKPLKDVIDGAIVGSHFIKLLESSNFSDETITTYIKTFKQELN